MLKQFRIFLAVALLSALCCSCNKGKSHDTPLRSETISVYTNANPGVMVNNIQVPFEGCDTGQIHILSDVPLEGGYRVDPSLSYNEQTWFDVTKVEQLEGNHLVLHYRASSIIEKNSLTRRSGTLSLSNAGIFLGKFVSVRQGYTVTYDAGFDSAVGTTVNLSPGMVYTTPTLNNINLHYYDYISFNAYATTASDPDATIITMDVSVDGSPYFEATGGKTMRLNIPVGIDEGPSNLHYLLIANHGERIGANVKLSFTAQNPAGTVVHLSNLRIYKVSEAELENLVDDEEDYDPDAENW